MEISAADTGWMLTSAALVLFMTPGLALFYGGMVRGKNVLGMLMKNFVAMGIVTITWVLVGASLAFSGLGAEGTGVAVGGYHILGDFGLAGFNGIGVDNSNFGLSIPDNVFLMFHLMFAIITPALIAGAIAERMKFTAWVAFIALWSVLVYVPMAHWVWGGGFIFTNVKAFDFAGGLVVHINAGAAALAVIMVLGPRLGFRHDIIRPHSLPLTLLGAGMLWFGWFGFNAGSALAATGQAGSAFMATQIAAGVAATVWIIAEAIVHGKPTTLGFASGAVAGLVAITPAAGYVGPLAAMLIGVAAGAVCFWALRIKFTFNFDDSLDVVAVHLVGGIIGSLAVGLLADQAFGGEIGPAAGMAQFGRQALSVGIALVYSFVVSYVLARILDATIGLRAVETDERSGLDLSLHGEQAYALSE